MNEPYDSSTNGDDHRFPKDALSLSLSLSIRFVNYD